jgi:hypothetical protein
VSFAVALPWLWLVDLPASMVVVIGCKHPRSTLRAVARKVESGCWVIRRRHGALEVGLAHPRRSLWSVLFMAGPLAPPIHPASRCPQLWRGAVVLVGRFSAGLCRDAALGSRYSTLVGVGGVGVDVVNYGCVPGWYPTSWVSRLPSLPS